MGDWKFHCDVLSLPPTASGDDIKATFRKLALRFHPDRNGGSAHSKEQFQRINISYRYLMRNLANRPAPEEPARPHPPRYRAPPARPWRLPNRKHLLAAGSALFVVAVAMLAPHEAARAPASLAPATADDFGRPKDKCDLLGFNRGNLRASSHAALSEWDCELRCNEWISAHEGYDDTCSWKGGEFRQHASLQNQISRLPVPPANGPMPPPPGNLPQAGLRDDGLYDEVSAYAKPEIMLDQVPDEVGVIPTEHQIVTMGVHYLIVTKVTARAWVSDSKILRADPGLSRLHVSITPIRHGEASVVITDKLGQPIKRYLYTVP